LKRVSVDGLGGSSTPATDEFEAAGADD
jgi:hypothetical protein